MARHPHEPHEFGVAPAGLAPNDDTLEDAALEEQPLPENIDLHIELAREWAEARNTPDAAPKDAATKANRELASLWDYKWALKHEGLQFSPQTHPLFDRIIVERCGIDNKGAPLNPAFNSGDPFYEDFAPLRRNLAILRHYLLATLLPEEKTAHRAMMRQMAFLLGRALAGGPPPHSPWGKILLMIRRFFNRKRLADADVSAFMQAGNTPDRGAGILYYHLLRLMKNPLLSGWQSVAIRPRRWPLAAFEATPFSEDNMLRFSAACVIEACANEIEQAAVQLKSLDTLGQDDKRIAVEEALNILRNLWKMMGEDERSGLDGKNATGTSSGEIADPAQEEASLMAGLISAFKDMVGDIGAVDLSLLKNPALNDAMNAIAQIGYRVMVEAHLAHRREGNHHAARRMSARIAHMPPEAKNEIPLKDLVSKLETGLNTAATIRQSIPPNRLAEAQAARAQSQAQIQGLASQQRNAQIARARAAAARTASDVMTRARVTQANNRQAAKAAEKLEHERILREQAIARQQQDSARKGR